MQEEILKQNLLMLTGIGRPTRKEQGENGEIEVEDWSEERTATTIQTLINENNRLEKELSNAKERYINDFLSPGKQAHNNINIPEPQKQEKVKVEDYLNF